MATTTTKTKKPVAKKKPAAKKPATTKAKPKTPAPAPVTEGIPFPFIGAGDASYFEWADLHIYFARDVKPADKPKLEKTVPPPIGDIDWTSKRHLYLSSEQGVGRQIQAAYAKKPTKPTSLTTTSRFKMADSPKLSRFNEDIERYLLEIHAVVPILVAFRRQDWEAGGTQLSPWHTASLAHAKDVLAVLKADKDDSLEYMTRGIAAEVEEAKKKKS
jgi:hypothetical protein